MTPAVRFRVYGKVQGVGFRAHARRIALSRQLDGWAINDSDGSVDILLLGNNANIIEAEALILKGPGFAKVERVERLDAPAEQPPAGFTIA